MLSELIDEDILGRLAAAVGAEMLGVLVHGFLRETRGRLRRMEEALETADLEALQFDAHSLKSAAATYALPVIAKHADEIEKACIAENQDTATAAARALLSSSSQFLDALEDRVA